MGLGCKRFWGSISGASRASSIICSCSSVVEDTLGMNLGPEEGSWFIPQHLQIVVRNTGWAQSHLMLFPQFSIFSSGMQCVPHIPFPYVWIPHIPHTVPSYSLCCIWIASLVVTEMYSKINRRRGVCLASPAISNHALVCRKWSAGLPWEFGVEPLIS